MMDVKTYTAADINESRADCLSRLRQADVNGVDADRAIASMDEVKFVTHTDYRAIEEQAAKDAIDAERWRWLVAENNKGGSRAKFLICWWSKDGDGYESTTGTSADGHDPETIVRLIDSARTPKEQTK